MILDATSPSRSVGARSNVAHGVLWLGVVLWFAALPTSAQDPHQALGPAGVNDVPPGSATIVGSLVHPDGSAKTAGATVILYSLATDGSPGMRTAKAGARGTFRFDGISNASGITYLIGASYRGVPYGKRVVFEADQRELTLAIDVADPVDDTSAVQVADSSLRLEWIGARLGIEEIHQLDNSAAEVVYVAPEKRAGKRPTFRTTLPEGATQIDTSLSGVAEGYEIRGRELLFWGPVYAGGMELRFRYMLAIPREHEGSMRLRWQLDAGSRAATLLYPPGGPTLAVAGVANGPDVQLGDVAFRSLDLGPVRPGDGVDMTVTIPTMSSDVRAIAIPRTDVWLDADDTFLQVNVETHLEVAPGAHLTGTPEAPLLRFELPPGAELLGASPEAQNLGLLPLEGGGLGILGPLSPGQSGFAFRYRAKVENGHPRLDLKLPGAVGTLNVLVADTGVVIDTDRLHRRRPFKQGTRVYLHREGFAIDAGEVIPIGLELIHRGSVSPRTHLVATTVLVAFGVWFIVSPLAQRRRVHGAVYEKARIRSERDIVYQSIRDLEHDFETGKIEQAEYTVMRDDLRARGLDLIRRERDAETEAATGTEPRPTPAAELTMEAKFCTDCGDRLQPEWRYCAKCGASAAGHAAPAKAGA